MEFMVKLQCGNIIQAKNFAIGAKDRIVIYESITGELNWWPQIYKTKQRRDEVFAQLEEWIRLIISFKYFGIDAIANHSYINVSEELIFTFPEK